MISNTASAMNLQTNDQLPHRDREGEQPSTSGMNPRNLSELIGSNAIRFVFKVTFPMLKKMSALKREDTSLSWSWFHRTEAS